MVVLKKVNRYIMQWKYILMCIGIIFEVIWVYRDHFNYNFKVLSDLTQTLKSGNKNNGYKSSLLNQNSNKSSSEKTCSPSINFAYVKTHKTGSTTVYEVMQKYLTKHKLRKIIKTPNPFLGGYPGHISPNLMFLADHGHAKVVEKGQSFVLIDHFRFNKTALKMVMPKDTLYFSVVREPWKNFQSAFHFYYHKPRTKALLKANCFHFPYFHVAKGKSIEIADYIRLADKRLNASIPWFFRSKNYQSHDLGLDPLLEDDGEIEQAIRRLESEIDLMMITEYMDQSMILLKKLLCMSWEDILFQDEGNNHNYQQYEPGEHEDVVQIFKKLDKVDMALYQHFNKTFWKKVKEYGEENMERDLKKLRSMKMALTRNNNPPRNERSVKILLREKANTKAFTEAQQHYDRVSMSNILHNKILHQLPILTFKQAKAVTDRMIDNGGGCPL